MAYSNKTATKKEFINQALTKYNANAWDMPEVELRKVNLTVESVSSQSAVETNKKKKIPATTKAPVNSTQTPIKINLALKGKLLDNSSLNFSQADREYPYGGEIMLGDVKLEEVHAFALSGSIETNEDSNVWTDSTSELYYCISYGSQLIASIESYKLILRKSNSGFPGNTNSFEPELNGQILYQAEGSKNDFNSFHTDNCLTIPVENLNIAPQQAIVEFEYTLTGGVKGGAAPIYMGRNLLVDIDYSLGDWHDGGVYGESKRLFNTFSPENGKVPDMFYEDLEELMDYLEGTGIYDDDDDAEWESNVNSMENKIRNSNNFIYKHIRDFISHYSLPEDVFIELPNGVNDFDFDFNDAEFRSYNDFISTYIESIISGGELDSLNVIYTYKAVPLERARFISNHNFIWIEMLLSFFPFDEPYIDNEEEQVIWNLILGIRQEWKNYWINSNRTVHLDQLVFTSKNTTNGKWIIETPSLNGDSYMPESKVILKSLPKSDSNLVLDYYISGDGEAYPKCSTDTFFKLIKNLEIGSAVRIKVTRPDLSYVEFNYKVPQPKDKNVMKMLKYKAVQTVEENREPIIESNRYM